MYSFSFDLSIFIKEDKWTSTQPWLEVVHVQVFHLFVLWDGVNITHWRQKCFIVLTYCIVFELFFCMFVCGYVLQTHMRYESRLYPLYQKRWFCLNCKYIWECEYECHSIHVYCVCVCLCPNIHTPYNGSLFWHNFGLLPIGVDMMLYEILIVFVYEHRRYATPHISQYPCMYVHVYVCNKNTSYNNKNMR